MDLKESFKVLDLKIQMIYLRANIYLFLFLVDEKARQTEKDNDEYIDILWKHWIKNIWQFILIKFYLNYTWIFPDYNCINLLSLGYYVCEKVHPCALENQNDI